MGDDRHVDYTYDPLNRLATAQAGVALTSYAYDPASNLTQTTLPPGNGYVETRAYDRVGRLTEVKSQKGGNVLAQFVATLDPVGNPTQVVRSGSLPGTQTYTYDASDRVLSVCFQAGTCPGGGDPFVRWTYDKIGNRLTEQRPAGTTSYTYDARDRLLSAGATNYGDDRNGNELSAGSRSFTYDLADRLKTTSEGGTTTYSYDGDGVRLQASTGTGASNKTNFLWDINHALPQLAAERDGAFTPLRRYTYGLRRIAIIPSGGAGPSYYHYDGLGSVANVTSNNGATQLTYEYEPFGPMRSETGSAPTNFFKFTGELLDPTGLYHLRARQYDPATGRFLRPDPVGQKPSGVVISSYGYAANRPTVMVDPSGTTFVSPNWFIPLTHRASSPEAVEPAASSRGLAPNAIIRRLRQTSSQTTRVIGWFSTANMGLPSVAAFKLTQEIDWGRVTKKSAVVKQVTFKYRVLTTGIVQGGRWDVYGGGDPYHYRSGFDDFDKAYTRITNEKESGKLTIKLNEIFMDNESFYVTIDKRSQFGSYYLGEDFHRKMRVAYGP